MFAAFANGATHHGNGRHAAWCKSTLDNQALMVRAAPDRFFKPPYVGPTGWVGVYLDGMTDWEELAEILRDGYRLVAPKRLLSKG